MADGQAADALLALGRAVVTSEFRINGVRPAVRERLMARAEPVASGGAWAGCRCEVYALADGAEEICAVAWGTIDRFAEVSS